MKVYLFLCSLHHCRRSSSTFQKERVYGVLLGCRQKDQTSEICCCEVRDVGWCGDIVHPNFVMASVVRGLSSLRGNT
jgi:hypothetical protein